MAATARGRGRAGLRTHRKWSRSPDAGGVRGGFGVEPAGADPGIEPLAGGNPGASPAAAGRRAPAAVAIYHASQSSAAQLRAVRVQAWRTPRFLPSISGECLA